MFPNFLSQAFAKMVEKTQMELGAPAGSIVINKIYRHNGTPYCTPGSEEWSSRDLEAMDTYDVDLIVQNLTPQQAVSINSIANSANFIATGTTAIVEAMMLEGYTITISAVNSVSIISPPTRAPTQRP